MTFISERFTLETFIDREFIEQVRIAEQAGELCSRISDEISLLVDLQDWHEKHGDLENVSYCLERKIRLTKLWAKADARYTRRASKL